MTPYDRTAHLRRGPLVLEWADSGRWLAHSSDEAEFLSIGSAIALPVPVICSRHTPAATAPSIPPDESVGEGCSWARMCWWKR
jgi:hypothetical protein